MKSRFTDLIKFMIDLKMTDEDMDKIIHYRVCEYEEIERIKEEVSGSDAREDEIARTIDEFNERELNIWSKYIKMEDESEE